MADSIELDKIKEKRETLVGQFNSLQDKKKELLKQIELVDTDIVTMRGAILLCNEWVTELEPEPSNEEETDGGQTN
jgi:predicted nuclease with TOPRIM domain